MKRSVLDVINARYSCRTYRKELIEDPLRGKLKDYFGTLRIGPFGSEVRLALVTASSEDPGTLKGLGTYGFIKGATGFLLGAVRHAPHDLEDFGYMVEQAILFATDLDLGTCWLGGSFNKSSFAKRLGGLDREETMPAVVSLGYPGDDGSGRIRDREVGGRRLPAPTLFFEESFARPVALAASDVFAEILEGVRMAPSASNKQPWRIVRQAEDWHFYLQRTKGYGKGTALFGALRLADLQRVDMGIAMCHFALLAEEAGLSGRWKVEEPMLGPLDPGMEYTATWQACRLH